MNAPFKFTRGERNNNPGNIRESKGDNTHWIGERIKDDDLEFEEFTDPIYGIRALALTLRNYKRKYGLCTIQYIIARWAPSNENDTDSYIRSVCQKMSDKESWEIFKLKILDLENPEILKSLTKAIIYHENGRCIYTDAQIAAGVNMALGIPTTAKIV